MERRSWPWKKKSSDKAATEKILATLESAAAPLTLAGSQGNHKKPKYVQISAELYSHLTGLEDQVKLFEDKVKKYDNQMAIYEDKIKIYDNQMTSYEDKVKALEEEVEELNEKLSAANSEMVAKESLVKQHAKVAEDAVSGWEKAEAEALALKNHLESVTLLKLTAEDRASHFDDALKECMLQIRNLKEDHERTLHEVVATKTRQCDMIKLELETQLGNLEQELLRSASDNAAISRSLQERSNMLIKISEEKSQAEAEIELLKSNIDTCNREINSLKYELHIVAKELEIRNEEKNMSVRSAEVANKQHLEGVKKIAKLEAECQRLRGLVRKKLPGPAALAQMKLEVESMGRDYGESRLRKSPAKPPTSPRSPHMTQLTEFSPDNIQKCHRDIELLTERLLAMEEETKMLKEALAKRNSELQASRSVCAKTVSKLQCIEAQLQANDQQRNIAKLNGPIQPEGSSSQHSSNPPSLTSMSEYGNNDEASYDGTCATELTHVKNEKNVDSPRKGEKSNQLRLMDDFLEMEKLAYSSKDSNGSMSNSHSTSRKSEVVNHDFGKAIDTMVLTEQPELDSLVNESSNVEDLPHYMELQARISAIFESTCKETDLEKLLDNIRNVVQDTHASLHNTSMSSSSEELHHSYYVRDHQAFPENSEKISSKRSSLAQDDQELSAAINTIGEEVAAAVSQIYEFVMLIGKAGKDIQNTSQEGDRLTKILEEFSAAFNQVLSSRVCLADFVLCLSQVFSKASNFHIDVLGYKNIEAEASSSDCIDKVALPENKAVRNSTQKYADHCSHYSDSTSDSDIPHEGPYVPTSELKTPAWNCSFEDFELLKKEKDNIVTDLARTTADLENTKSRLCETEDHLAEVKSQLASAQKVNSLAETQLKCMAESYRSLEKHAEELQVEVDLLKAKTEGLDGELQVERRNHEDALSKCKVLQEELKRIQSYPTVQIDAKSSQETEIAAAAEKLAECQETIFLLGKQLKSMRHPFVGSPTSRGRAQSMDSSSFEDKPTSTDDMILQDVDISEIDSATSANMHCVVSESDILKSPTYPSDSEASTLSKSPIGSELSKHRPTKSGSSSSYYTPTPAKHRGISRFFSTKAKNDD